MGRLITKSKKKSFVYVKVYFTSFMSVRWQEGKVTQFTETMSRNVIISAITAMYSKNKISNIFSLRKCMCQKTGMLSIIIAKTYAM